MVSTTAIVSTATPAVVVALFGLFVFGFTLQWFPTGYAADTSIDPAFRRNTSSACCITRSCR